MGETINSKGLEDLEGKSWYRWWDGLAQTEPNGKIKIWLDDERSAPDNTWVVCRTVVELWEVFWDNVGDIEVISFDHDLGEENILTGYDFLLALEKLIGTGEIRPNVLPDRFEIHSMNPVGRMNMQRSIDKIEELRYTIEDA